MSPTGAPVPGAPGVPGRGLALCRKGGGPLPVRGSGQGGRAGSPTQGGCLGCRLPRGPWRVEGDTARPVPPRGQTLGASAAGQATLWSRVCSGHGFLAQVPTSMAPSVTQYWPRHRPLAPGHWSLPCGGPASFSGTAPGGPGMGWVSGLVARQRGYPMGMPLAGDARGRVPSPSAPTPPPEPSPRQARPAPVGTTQPALVPEATVSQSHTEPRARRALGPEV